MKAILTKYHPPTAHRAARVSAQDMDGNRITIAYTSDQIEDMPTAHRAAAVALCNKMGWTGADTLIAGTLAHHWVFVWPSMPSPNTIAQEKQALKEINALELGEHSEADQILLRFCPSRVVKAWEKLVYA